ncbi:DEAD/DEAH box helicase [Mesorhizobium sp. WSM2561]|uniref:DEAD/DEAH box helicase n=1 Tax=Mesorhizobium sp. WSM2561 TaxID=1040985 RepID=UPI0004ACD9DB|nr:DEAD/DEAH box helicase [Mesorhizobium sp. WSM2561]
MSFAFVCESGPAESRITLAETRLLGKRLVPVDHWGEAPQELQATVRRLVALIDTELAATDGITLTIPNEDLLALPGAVLMRAGLPEVAGVVIRLELSGRAESPDGLIRVLWEDPLSRRLNPRIKGLIIETANGRGRLTGSSYNLLRAIEAYNKTIGRIDRIPHWHPVQELLGNLTDGRVRADRLLTSLRIHQAGAFGLDVREAVGGPTFDPILMGVSKRRSLLDDTPESEDIDADLRDSEKDALLKQQDHLAFAKAFRADNLPTRPAYPLGRNTYLVLEPDLREALDVVKRMRTAHEAERRDFLKNPRTYLCSALQELGEMAGTIFVETHQYSERVRGLGLWEKPKLTWLTRKSSGWLPEGFVIRIGQASVEVDEQGIDDLALAAERASEGDASLVSFRGVDYPRLEVEAALDGLRGQFDEDSAPAEPADRPRERPEDDHQVLLIDDHIEEAKDARTQQRRMELPLVFPSDVVSTKPKEHQQRGFQWLVKAWAEGFPGVLLADDMGLGKTLQALAFLTWFRANRAAIAGSVRDIAGPILIVAPTALLRNWRKEADTHLIGDALGDCLEAFGSRLKSLKIPVGREWTPEDALDAHALRSADWILTTYETLATYHRAFARIPYSIVIFDEMQKIKAPDTINTHSAKTLNANFVIGLTGTPIENRIEDLWCIMDRVSPGYLGGLKAFSKTYGGEDADALKDLKQRLDQWVGKRPPVMLRRMKADHLPGLPNRAFDHQPSEMPRPQAEAYEAVVRAAQQQRGSKNDMLKTIHDMRGISLHPNGGGDIDITDPAARREWIEASARVTKTMEILRRIQANNEKALVFIEDRAVQATFAAVVAEEFNLPSIPSIINGSLDGDKRQAVVDRFQASKPGFGLLVLSPKAAGIGLTITAANHVIHLSRWWNPAVEDQCNDRAFRIGQDKAVTVHLPIARHPVFGDSSFDVKLNALLERKRALSRDMLVPPVWDADIDDLFSATVVN